MNEYEIERAVTGWSFDLTLGPAARTLNNLMREVNRKSDGWPYWQPPRRASRKLQELVSNPPKTREEIDAAYRAALTPVKAFRTRHGFEFEIEESRR